MRSNLFMRLALGGALFASLTAACASDNGGGSEVDASSGTPELSTEESAFCEKARASFGEDPSDDEFRAGAPDHVAAMDDEGLVRWVESHCHPEIAVDGEFENRRYATPVEDLPEGVQVCNALSVPSDLMTAPPMPMAIYAPASSADPFGGPMIAVLQGSHGGDGRQVDVHVRGTAGKAEPITVFQQTILPELGTVVSWKEGGDDYNIVARLWDQTRVPELVDLANKLTMVDGLLQFPNGALPAGYRKVFAGSSTNADFFGPLGSPYLLQYGASGAIIQVNARAARVDEPDAFRLFGLNMSHEKIGDHDALIGNVWGPHSTLITWREPDGTSVRVFGMGAPDADVRKIAAATRALSANEWASLAEASSTCER